MPPKVKITKEMIIDAAFEIARRLSAPSIAGSESIKTAVAQASELVSGRAKSLTVTLLWRDESG